MKRNQRTQNIALKFIFLICGVLAAALSYSFTGNFLLAFCFFILGASFSIAFKE